MPSELTYVYERTSSFSLRDMVLMARCLLALPMLSMAGCIMWPQKTTYYEAVDKPSIPSMTEGNLTRCPSTTYGEKLLGETSVWVLPSYEAGRGRIRVQIGIRHGDPLAFQPWRVQFTSLTDPHARSSVPLILYVHCLKEIESCPKLATGPKTDYEVESASTMHRDFFDGIADIPREFVGGYILELQSSDGDAVLGLKPQRFELRTKVLAKGTFGCY